MPDRVLLLQRWVACLLSLGLFAYYAFASLHWPVVWDGAVMHYIHFLITRGFQPYIDITDMNLPGCYLAEGWAMAVFGWGDLSWRFYEFFLMALLAGSGMVIGGARHWFTGVYAALFFVLMHGSEGPMMAVERDEVMTVLLVTATAFFFVALRRGRPWLLLPFGMFAAFAASLKPGAILLDGALIALAWVTLKRGGKAAGRFLFWALLGNLIVLGLSFGYLLWHHAFPSLWFTFRHVLPAYVREKNLGRLYLLRHLTPVPLIPLIAAALVSAGLKREKIGWERAALFLGMATGAFSYWAQAKGYLYHRYMYMAFVLLWVGWELTGAQFQSKTFPRLLETVGLLLLFGVATPFYVDRIYQYPRRIPPPQALAFSLERDLSTLGGSSLQKQVQCMDLVNGCLNALYRLRLVQNTGTTGDLLLFSPTPGPAVRYYRNWLETRERADPPTVVVLGNEWYYRYAVSFDKIDTWPEYAAQLREGYVPVIERHFGVDNSPAYRIYLRKGSSVLAQEQAHPLH